MCTSFFQQKTLYFCSESSFRGRGFLWKTAIFFRHFVSFLGPATGKKTPPCGGIGLFLGASTWRHLECFCDIRKTPGSAWASTESDSSFPLCSSDSFSLIYDFCSCPVAPGRNPKRRRYFYKKSLRVNGHS
jgi:hypothetical protein